MRTIIVFNPTAGQAGALEHDLAVVADVWRQHGWEVELRPTRTAGDGTTIARQAAASGYNLVVAAGGDGTINEVINGLVGSDTALATLPFGTMNVWARELRLPLQPRAAAEALLDWKLRRIDLGKANDHHFLLMAGIGFDAAITAGVKRDEKRRFGALAYVLRGLDLALRIRGTRTRLIIDGRMIKARVLMIVIGNTQLYGGLVKITHQASLDDGLLDVCVIQGDNFFSALRSTFSILAQRRSHDPEISYYRARQIDVLARPRMPIQVDGDAIGHTPMRFSVVPGAIVALLPPDLPQDLIHAGHEQPLRPKRAVSRMLGWFARNTQDASEQRH